MHLVGVGDSSSGIRYIPDMDKWFHPIEKMQKWFYMHAACGNVKAHESVDKQVVDHLFRLMQDFPSGAKAMLFAFDACYSEAGQELPEQTAFYIPNAYAAKIAREHYDRFEWAASIHPYRKDAIEALHHVVASGARAIKWLPAAMESIQHILSASHSMKL